MQQRTRGAETCPTDVHCTPAAVITCTHRNWRAQAAAADAEPREVRSCSDFGSPLGNGATASLVELAGDRTHAGR